jgi:hypothetical protein
MADSTQTSPFAPTPHFPERLTPVWEGKMGVNTERRGPLRFEEGIATDTDIPNGFRDGIMQGYGTAPGRPNHNQKVDTKYPQETLRERAHVGSSSWVEAPTFRSEFAHGAVGDHGVVEFEQINRGESKHIRANYATVTD